MRRSEKETIHCGFLYLLDAKGGLQSVDVAAKRNSLGPAWNRTLVVLAQ